MLQRKRRQNLSRSELSRDPSPPPTDQEPTPLSPSQSPVESETEKTHLIVEAALELKAESIVALDMRSLSAFADTFLITSGRSSRHVRSIAESIIHALREAGESPLGVEGLNEGRWVLIDANEAIIHVFEPNTREEFALERLWSDAPLIDLEHPEIQSPSPT